MGRTLKKLSSAPVKAPAVFDKRFVVELCEQFHVHYRNLRLQLNPDDFIAVAQGFIDALARWRKQGSPEPAKTQHIELCRKQVARDSVNNGIQVNLNENLYDRFKGKIFAEGADVKDKVYVHVKVRDIRLEMTVDEFREFAKVVKEADGHFENGDSGAVLQAPGLHEQVPSVA